MLRFLGIALLGGAIGAGATGVASLAAALPDGHTVTAAVQEPGAEQALAILAQEGLTFIAHDEDEDQTGSKDEDEKKGALGRGDAFAAARTYLGLEQKDIQAALKEGKSLAELAVSKGKTRDGLIAAILAALPASVDQAAAKLRIEKLVDAKTQPKPARPAIKKEGTLDRIEKVLDALVAAGKITAEQKTAILAGLKGAFERKPDPRADAFRFSGEVYQVARDYLGATQEEIAKAYKDGKSLAELAVAKGKTRDGLIQAILAAVLKASPTTDVAKATEAIGKIVDQKFRPNAGLNKPKPTDKPRPSVTPKPSATPKPSPTATATPSATPTASPTATANVTNLRFIQSQSVRTQLESSGYKRR